MLKHLAWWIVGLCIWGISGADAAHISVTSSPSTTIDQCSLRVEGRITAGDAEKVEAILANALGAADQQRTSRTPVDAEYNDTFVVCLSGPGGSYLEGIALADVFAKFRVATVIPDNEVCLSACAIAFLGGQSCCDDQGEPFAQRFIFPGSKLGFHSPLFRVSAGEYSAEAALKAYDLGLEAVARLRQKTELFLINDEFLAEIFEHKGEDFYYIETLDDAEINEILLTGFGTRRLKTDTNQAACWNAWNWQALGSKGLKFQREQDNFSTTSDAFWRSVFEDFPSADQYFERGSGLYVFTPFDGNVRCLVREVRHHNRRMFEVIISELGGDVRADPAPRVRGIFRPTVLMRGNRTLVSTR